MIWTGYLISLAVFLQTLESASIRAWPWRLVEGEMPRVLRPLLRRADILLWLRAAAALSALALPNGASVFLMWMTTWLLAIRWRGTFNGGSDTMTFHILTAWMVSLWFPQLERACLYYIAVQLILSYFIAGVAKASRREWWSGEALAGFLRRYRAPVFAPALLSWAIVAFELAAPLAWIAPVPFAAAAMAFHLLNVYVFGLNRFFWAWLAAYPALFAVVGLAGPP